MLIILRLIDSQSHTHTDSNSSANISALPLTCPQPFAASSTYTEDCLSMILYVPTASQVDSGVPTLMWYA